MQLVRDLKFWSRTNAPLIFVVSFAILATFAIVVTPKNVAFAWPWDDVANWFTSALRNAVNANMETAISGMRMQDTTKLLTSSWTNLFGDNETIGIANFADSICNIVVKPIAFSILSFVILVQFVKITTSASSNDMIPCIREIFMFMIVAIILYSIIQYSDQLFKGVYEIINYIAGKVARTGQEMATTQYATEETDFGKLISMLIMSFFCVLVSIIASAITMVVCYARGIQLYAYLAFSPIPLSLIGIDETRSFGVAYIRNFAAVCLASCIILFVLYCIPYLSQIILVKAGEGNDIGQLIVNILIVAGVMILAVAKSGGWAKEVLGA